MKTLNENKTQPPNNKYGGGGDGGAVVDNNSDHSTIQNCLGAA